MTEPRYEVILYWSSEDEAFIAEVPELPGCAADGASYQEALGNVQVIIEEWIETAKELGRAIPEPRNAVELAHAHVLSNRAGAVTRAGFIMVCPSGGSRPRPSPV